jgi:hypothetical protein
MPIGHSPHSHRAFGDDWQKPILQERLGDELGGDLLQRTLGAASSEVQS